MLDLGIPAKLVSFTKMTKSHTATLASVKKSLTDAFNKNVGKAKRWDRTSNVQLGTRANYTKVACGHKRHAVV